MNRVKRFRTKRLWYNTKAWAYVSVAVVLGSLVLAAVLRVLPIAFIGAGLVLLGFVLAMQRDRRRSGAYLVDSAINPATQLCPNGVKKEPKMR